jgi:hypothetical protein
MVRWLSEAGHRNIIILDNKSSYPPLLEWYEQQSIAKIVYLDQNLGPLALWLWEGGQQIIREPYVYTDSDIDLAGCPQNLVERLADVLRSSPGFQKVGTALRIDDLPANEITEKVRRHERQFWLYPRRGDLYRASVDTTFALYRPGSWGGYWLPALRLAGKYSARHAPWYVEPSNLTDEEAYYREHASYASSWASNQT